MKQEKFGIIENQEISLFTLTNSNGMELQVTNYGAIITSLKIKNNKNELKDIVLGFNSFDDYLNSNYYYLGTTIGRFGNRIKDGIFKLNETTYTLDKNEEGSHHLHGGVKGFDKVIWDAEAAENSIELSYFSCDGEEGYPGNLQVKIKYSLTDENEFILDYSATTDKDTVINLTNHSYFNLNGDDSGEALNHKLKLNADNYTPTDAEGIPTGEIRNVKNSAFDFKDFHTIGERIESDEEQIKFKSGYDINYVLDNQKNELKEAGILKSEESGIEMQVLTTEPAIQFYTMNDDDNDPEDVTVIEGKNGTYLKRNGICLETQHSPDSPNQPNFPSTTLKVGDIYNSQTIYKFSVLK